MKVEYDVVSKSIIERDNYLLLKEYGYNGWELCAVTQFEYIFKREQPKDELPKLIEWMEKEYISIPESDGNLVVIKTAKTILEKAKAIQNENSK